MTWATKRSTRPLLMLPEPVVEDKGVQGRSAPQRSFLLHRHGPALGLSNERGKHSKRKPVFSTPQSSRQHEIF